ncbi:MAG: aerotolerance regulator BatC [Bacteroidales bacterium]|jgi:tetratricopeptide (TPR) repeat protein|nr:aerotolerance regulator BatC [Bacteroidales bacterium]
MKIKVVFFAILMILGEIIFAQNPLRQFRNGNEAYRDSNYTEAQIYYAKGLNIDSNNVCAYYNLANTLYKEGNYEMADTLYQAVQVASKLTSREKSEILHNRGNISIQKEDYANAVKNYKEALKFNGRDKDTKYNLTYALNKLQQQQNQQDKDKQNKDNQDKQKNQQNKEQQNKDQGQDKGQQQNQLQQMSKEDAERILKAVENREKETLDKKKEVKVGQRGRIEKDW